MWKVNYDTKECYCPYCGEGFQADERISDKAWINHVNEFIEDHRECEAEDILGLPNDRLSRTNDVHYSENEIPICGAKPGGFRHETKDIKDVDCKLCLKILVNK